MDPSSPTPSAPTAVQTVAFSFESLSEAPGTPWQREGKGNARFEGAGERLQVEETGVWWDRNTGSGKHHAFRKLFQLERNGSECIRYLKPAPDGDLQELLTLVPGKNGGWHSPEPHLCVDDIYRAELSLDTSDTLHMTWWSEGPQKNYTLHTHYQGAQLCRSWLES